MSLPDDFDVNRFLAEIDKQRDLRGARVVYFDGTTMSVVRVGPPMCQSGLLAVVIRRGGPEVIPSNSEIAAARDERFNSEALNLALSCGAAVVAWLVFLGSSGAAPVTGGTSLIVSKLSGAAGVASGLQCLNAGYRMYNEVYDPDSNDYLDSQWWYTPLCTAADAVSVVGAATASTATIRMVKLLKNSTGKSTVAVVKGLSRQERKKLAEEIVRVQNPGISNHELKVLVRRGIFPKRYTNAELRQGIRKQLLDAVGAAVSFSGSATGGILSKAGRRSSGGALTFGVVNAFETM